MINASGFSLLSHSNWFSLFYKLLLGGKFKVVSCKAVIKLHIQGGRTQEQFKTDNHNLRLICLTFCLALSVQVYL